MKAEPLKTFELKDLYEMARREPQKTFDEWRIFEVRKKCLETMKNWEVYGYLVDWVEKHIRELLVTGRRDLPEAMLDWYVFNAQENVAVRAVEFSLSLANGEKAVLFFENAVSKIVAGRLLKNEVAVLYHKLPSLPKFLEELLEKLNSPYQIKKEGRQYSDSDWVCAERALRIIVEYKDFSFLPQIEKIIVFMQTGKIVAPDKPFYAGEAHLGAFKEAKEILLKARKDSLLGKAD